jgi:predicted methyltransferase
MRTVALAFALVVNIAAAGAVPDYVTRALASPARPASDREHDEQRKAAECVALSGLKPGDRIADVYPGRGYFSRIFSHVVGPNGRVYPVVPQILATPGMEKKFAQAQFADPAYQNVTVLVRPTDAIAAPEPLDVVWVGKVYHDMPNVELGPTDIAAMNRAIYKALKPGGVYIVTDHAATPGSGFVDVEPDNSKRLHRIDPAVVKRQVEAAGFVLEAQSDLLANPGDSHTASVFDASIKGRTDQFFFKFRKPR